MVSEVVFFQTLTQSYTEYLLDLCHEHINVMFMFNNRSKINLIFTMP